MNERKVYEIVDEPCESSKPTYQQLVDLLEFSFNHIECSTAQQEQFVFECQKIIEAARKDMQ